MSSGEHTAGGGGTLLEEFFVRLGVKPDHEALNKFTHSLTSVHHAMEALGVLAAVELAKRFAEFIERNIAAAAAVQETADVIDMEATSIEAFNEVAIQGGVSAQEMQASLEGLTRAAGAAEAGFPRFTKLFKEQLGIDPKGKDTEQIFEELSQKFEKMDAGTRNAVAGRLGLTPKLAKLMAENKEFAAQVAEYKATSIMSNQDFENAHKAEIAFSRLHKIFSQVVAVIAIQLTPVVKKVTEAFTEWWRAHKTEIVTRLSDAVRISIYFIKQLWGWVKDTASMLNEWRKKIGELFPGMAGWKIALMAIVAIKLANWVYGVVLSLRTMTPLLGTVALVALGIAGIISIAMQLKAAWGPIMLWMRDMWREIVLAVKDLGEGILKIPGFKWALDKITGGGASRFMAEQQARHEKDAKDASFFSPANIQGGQLVHHIRTTAEKAKLSDKPTLIDQSTVRVDTIHINADKGREAAVGESFEEQVRKAREQVRLAQGPFKS